MDSWCKKRKYRPPTSAERRECPGMEFFDGIEVKPEDEKYYRPPTEEEVRKNPRLVYFDLVPRSPEEDRESPQHFRSCETNYGVSSLIALICRLDRLS